MPAHARVLRFSSIVLIMQLAGNVARVTWVSTARETSESNGNRRIPTPGDIARLGLFLASEDSGWVNGAIFLVGTGSTSC